MVTADAIHEHMAGLLIPFITFLVIILAAMGKIFLNRIDKSNQKLSDSNEELGKQVFNMGTKIDNLSKNIETKVDKDKYHDTIKRVFTRIEEVEQKNDNLSERVHKIELQNELP